MLIELDPQDAALILKIIKKINADDPQMEIEVIYDAASVAVNSVDLFIVADTDAYRNMAAKVLVIGRGEDHEGFSCMPHPLTPIKVRLTLTNKLKQLI